jgi:transcription termination factor Rho
LAAATVAAQRGHSVTLFDAHGEIGGQFKGTGNSEIILDRKVADKRIFPAIDIIKSGTRKEELITPRSDLQKTYVLRRILNPMGPQDAIEFLLDKLRQTKQNSEFFDSMNT